VVGWRRENSNYSTIIAEIKKMRLQPSTSILTALMVKVKVTVEQAARPRGGVEI
jgi:hypothetical protein